MSGRAVVGIQCSMKQHGRGGLEVLEEEGNGMVLRRGGKSRYWRLEKRFCNRGIHRSLPHRNTIGVVCGPNPPAPQNNKWGFKSERDMHHMWRFMLSHTSDADERPQSLLTS